MGVNDSYARYADKPYALLRAASHDPPVAQELARGGDALVRLVLVDFEDAQGACGEVGGDEAQSTSPLPGARWSMMPLTSCRWAPMMRCPIGGDPGAWSIMPRRACTSQWPTSYQKPATLLS